MKSPQAALPLSALVILVALSWTLEGSETESTESTETAPAAVVADAAAQVAACADCHDIDNRGYVGNPHAVLNQDPALAAHFGVANSCEGCHGDATAHIESGGETDSLFVYGPGQSAAAQTDSCLSCHADAHPRFPNTRHAAAGLSCTDCHTIHDQDPGRSLLPKPQGVFAAIGGGSASAVCADCHGDVMARFQLNERHRLEEGILDCSSCHDPHAPEARLQLGGFKQEQCVQCHTDKGGPFVFEHHGQRVEGCVACHQPHGSVNRHMLTFQSVADLCYSCHAVVPGFHTRFDNTTQCTNCHSTIHGSNFDPAFLK